MGRVTTSARRRELPPIYPPAQLTPDDVVRFRAELGYSQSQLARSLGLSIDACQSWEQRLRSVPKWLPLAFQTLRFRAIQRKSVAKRRKRERLLAESLIISPPVKHLFY